MKKSVYNATVTGKILLTPDLMVLRVKTNESRAQFKAGQYTTIGLNAYEKRSANSNLPIDTLPDDELIIRPYSIASANHATQDFEFYISQVKSGQLTPRLFNLSLGRRMWVSKEIVGVFNLADTPENCNIVMVATGTGLAPYISFLRSHINTHRNIHLAVLHGAAYPWDLGYYSELSFIENAFPNFHYFPTLLKADSSWNGLSGYIEKHLENKILENAGVEVHPDKTHFFLCGNPKMVESMKKYLGDLGYTVHSDKAPGALHIEEY